jgi:hypothetical protein
MNKKIISVNTKKHSVPLTYLPPSNNISKMNHFANNQDDNYFQLDDFDNVNGWEMKELDMLEGMGFQIEGNTHMGLSIPGIEETINYTIAKHKTLGHEMKVNDRKYYFKTFDHMLEKIDEFGKLDI